MRSKKDNYGLKILGIILMLIALMCIFVVFSTDIKTHDGDEYRTFAKHLAGIHNIKLFWIHSAPYALLGAVLVKAFHSILAFRLLGTFLLAIIGFLLWHYGKSLKAALLWFISPAVWYINGTIYPVILGALLLFLAYIYWKGYEKKGKYLLLLLSGALLGLANASTETNWPVTLFFLLIFFYDRKLKELMLFALPFLAGFGVKLAIDYMIFGNPWFSLFRFAGANALIFMGVHPENKIYALKPLFILIGIIVISPLQFLLYKLYKTEYKKDLFFVAASLFFILFIYSAGSIHHFFVITPIAIYLLAKVISKKQAVLGFALAIPIVLLISLGGLGQTDMLAQDIKNIQSDFKADAVIADRNLELPAAARIWDSKPMIIWLDEYIAGSGGAKAVAEYDFTEKPKIDVYKIASLKFSYLANANSSYPANLPMIVEKGKPVPLEGYSMSKCYERICVYEKKKS